MIVVAPKFKQPLQGEEYVCSEDPDRVVSVYADEEKVGISVTNGPGRAHRNLYFRDTAERIFWTLGKALGYFPDNIHSMEFRGDTVRVFVIEELTN